MSSPYTSASTTSTSTGSQPQTQGSQYSRIQKVVTERNGQGYASDPQDMDVPEFIRKGSFYDTGLENEPDFRYLQASDVRHQVQEAPSRIKAAGKYPRTYHNNPPQPLSAQAPYREFPIVPSPRNGEAPGNYTRGMDPGSVRAFYNDGNRSDFDVGYHDSSRAPMGPRMGRPHVNSPYSLATYSPGPDYTDTSRLQH